MMASPTFLVLINAIFFSIMGGLLWIVAITTDQWDNVTYRRGLLDEAYHAVNTTTRRVFLSMFGEEGSGFVEIKSMRYDSTGNLTGTEYRYTFDTYGGMWRTCDYLTVDQRKALKEVIPSWHTNASCFNYITEYKSLIESLTEKARWLVRMQNSAAACIIVVCLLIACSFVTSLYGLLQKQVAVCMVTSVMYVLAAVFSIFGLAIIHAKSSYMMYADCYTLVREGDDTDQICPSKLVWQGWSIVVGWIAMSFFLLAFMFWSFLCRWMRQEKAKHFPT